MEKYLTSSLKEIRTIYLPEKSFFDTNPFRKVLNRTDAALKGAILVGSCSGPAALSFDEEKFLQNATLEDFKKDIFEIVTEKKWIFLKDVHDFTKTELNRDYIQYHLKETRKEIDNSIKYLSACSSDSPRTLDKAVIEILYESYRSALDELFSLYDYQFPGIFQQSVSSEEPATTKEPEVNNDVLAGLILAKWSMPPGRSKKLCSWLKRAELIHKNTKAQTLRNIFVWRQTHSLTKVQWIGLNGELKYFINLLHQEAILKPSGYNQKWNDVASVFVDRLGNSFVNTKLSKNSEPLKPEVQTKIVKIVQKLKADLKK